MTKIAFAFMAYCLTCSGTDPVIPMSPLYSTREICERKAQERVEQVFPPGHRYAIDCMEHGVQPGDVVVE
jgi:hypothetical protein